MQTPWNDAQLIAAIGTGKESERNRVLQYIVQHPVWRQQVLRHVAINSGSQEDGEEIFSEAICILDRNLPATTAQSRPYDSIAEVASKVGCDDARSFARSFKQRFGKLPSQLLGA